MTIEMFLAILVKRWWLVLLCSLMVGAGAYIGSRFMTPFYQSASLIQIAIHSSNNPGDYYTGLLASEQLVQTEATLATSDPVVREVVSHYPKITVEQLSREVTAAPRLNTQLFEIDVQDSSPSRAALLANDIARTLIKQQAQAFQQNAVQSGVYLLIVQPAQPGLSPVRPNKLLNTGAGLLGGLLLGMFLVMLLEMLDTRVRTPEALTRLLGWPVLATLWYKNSQEDIVNLTGYDANAEPYRILRTNIGFSSIDKPSHSLMVTSVLPRDGKSVIAANLAIFMAKAGKTTLLIDANLRHPTLNNLFGLSIDKLGLSNAILAFNKPSTANESSSHRFSSYFLSTHTPNTLNTSNVSLESYFHPVHIPNLWVMPSGPIPPPNAPELLESKAMQNLLEEIANCGAEIVIFDSPALLGLSDATILASKVDGTLIVVDITRARKGSLKHGKALLEGTKTHVLGCVVNKRRPSRKDPIYSYSYRANKQKEGGNLDMEYTDSPMTLLVTPYGSQEPGTASELILKQQDEVENHCANNMSSCAVSTNALSASDRTIKLSRDNGGKCEQCDDG